MAQRLEDLVIRLTADNVELKRSLNRSQAAIADFSRQSTQSFGAMRAAVGGLTTALAAIGGVAVFKNLAEASINFADSLQNSSERIGITAEELQRLQAAAEPVGVKNLDGALTRLSKTIGEAKNGTGTLVRELRDTNPELLAALQGAKNAADGYLILADAAKAIQDPTERARVLSAAFGRSWAENAPLLMQGADAIEAAGDRAERLGRILGNDAVKALDDFGDTIEDIGRVALAQFSEGLATSATGAESLGAALSDEDTIRGIGEFASALGSIVGFTARLAAALPDAISRLQAFIPLLDVVERNRDASSRIGASGSWGVSESDRAAHAASLGFDPFGSPIRSTPQSGRSSSARADSERAAGGGSRRRAGSRSTVSDYLGAIDFGIGGGVALGDPVSDAEFDALFDGINASLDEVESAFNEHAERMEARGELFGDFVGNVFRDFAEDGKIELRELGLSFAQMLLEMSARAAASSLFGGAGKAGGAGGFLSGLFSSLVGGLSFFADGGIVRRPTLAMIGEGGEPEAVIPLSKLQGTGGGNVIVHNYAAPQSEVTASRNARGDTEVYVRNVWRRDAARGEFRDALGQRHAPGVG